MQTTTPGACFYNAKFDHFVKFTFSVTIAYQERTFAGVEKPGALLLLFYE